jgi:3-deoxy-D-manno-octulosonic-acid transferase
VILAPRHIENAAEILAKVQGVLGDAGLRSAGSLAPVLVLDTYGELGNLYAAADLAVIGGGFSPLGGQNLIQPLAWGIPVLHGEHMTNFKSASEAALTAGASMVVRSSDELFAALEALHADPARRTKMGSAGKKLVEESRGASARYATEIIKEAKSSRAFQRLLKRKSAKDAKIS